MSRRTPESTRQEIKFVAYETEMPGLLQWIRIHRARFYRPYPDRRVSNVYFDTHDLAACSENLSGASARTKVRYRWYGDLVAPAAGTLEIKRKRNFFGWKIQYRVEEEPYTEGATWGDIRQNIMRQVPSEGRMWFKLSPAPVILNRYLRRYFVSADNNIRLTVDCQQSVFDQRLKSTPNFSRPAHLPRSLVVEFKFAREDRQLASDFMQAVPVRVSRHSKYMNGVLAAQHS
jgi:hypothetical protein